MNRKVIFIFLLLLPALAYGNAGSRFHRVRQGDSLSQIANRYGITVNAIKAWNKIQGSSIHPGRLLKVGVRKKAPPRRRRWKKIAPLKEERSIKIIGPTFVTLPYNYSPPPAQLQEHRDDLFTLRVYAADFRQGNAAYLEIMPAARSMSLPRI